MKKKTLIVTEKPDVAKRIAYALDYKRKPKQLKKNGIPYYLAKREHPIIIVPSIGHLYTIIQNKGKHNYYPVFNFMWVPLYLENNRAKLIRNWIKTYSFLSTDVEEFISACDYDLEGSLIGYFILKYACGKKELSAKRMKFSTLIASELEKSYENSLCHLNFPLIHAAKTKHEIDWLYGINLSRALIFAKYRWSGKYLVLSTGRVQGPTLWFLAEREKQICSFVPTPYWQLNTKVKIKNMILEAEYEKKPIKSSATIDSIIIDCKDKNGRIKNITVKNFYQKPPYPFNLGTLQHESYRLFGYSPRYTLSICQQLYLNALVSYPRTNSQKLPPIINYKKILEFIEKKPKYKRLASTLLKKKILIPNEGPEEDFAHPAIYPTGTLPKNLKTSEQRIWDLIVHRFMAVFGENTIKESQNIKLEVKGHTFFIRGMRVLKNGWQDYYQNYIRNNELFLPKIKKNDSFFVSNINKELKYSSPPSRYNQSSLLKKMEETGIGTKATRADIIQTLYNRGYVKEKRITVTDLGLSVVDVLYTFSQSIISTSLTKEIEKKITLIKENKIKSINVLLEVIKKLKLQLENFKKNEEIIGQILTKAIELKPQDTIVGNCPICNTGKLRIIYSKKSKKRFIGCTNYFNGLCKTSFSIPQKGKIRILKIKCKACYWPQISILFRRGKNRSFCFNPNCSINKK